MELFVLITLPFSWRAQHLFKRYSFPAWIGVNLLCWLKGWLCMTYCGILDYWWMCNCRPCRSGPWGLSHKSIDWQSRS